MSPKRVDALIKKAAQLFDTTERDIRGSSRFRDHTYPRMILYLVLKESGMSYAQVGQRLGRDAKTVSHGCSVIRPILEKDTVLQDRYKILKDRSKMRRKTMLDERFQRIENAQVALAKAMLPCLDPDPDYDSIKQHIETAVSELRASGF